jgi:hypothetical protein
MVNIMWQETAGKYSLHWRLIQKICSKEKSFLKRQITFMSRKVLTIPKTIRRKDEMYSVYNVFYLRLQLKFFFAFLPVESRGQEHAKRRCCTGKSLESYLGSARFETWPGHQISWVFRGFPQPLQANMGTISFRPLPFPLKFFVIYQSSHHHIVLILIAL